MYHNISPSNFSCDSNKAEIIKGQKNLVISSIPAFIAAVGICYLKQVKKYPELL